MLGRRPVEGGGLQPLQGQKIFHKKQLLFNKIGRRFARDNTDFATRATHVKVRQYAVLKGKTFTLTNGVHILQCPIKLNPALNYYKAKRN